MRCAFFSSQSKTISQLLLKFQVSPSPAETSYYVTQGKNFFLSEVVATHYQFLQITREILSLFISSVTATQVRTVLYLAWHVSTTP